jgi:hypothetical protein
LSTGRRSATRLAQPWRKVQFGHCRADRQRLAQQAFGFVVARRHPAGRVHREHALADPVQHGLPLVEQLGQLVRFQAVREPVQPPGEQRRRADTERQRTRRERDADQDQPHQLPDRRPDLVPQPLGGFEGLDVELQSEQSGATAETALISGQVDGVRSGETLRKSGPLTCGSQGIRGE